MSEIIMYFGSQEYFSQQVRAEGSSEFMAFPVTTVLCAEVEQRKLYESLLPRCKWFLNRNYQVTVNEGTESGSQEAICV